MSDTYTTPEGRLDDLVKDLVVAGTIARQGRLNTGFADRVVTRLRSAASDMVEYGDAELLRAAAERLESVSLRVKSQTGRRVPVSGTAATAAAVAERSQAELAAQFDKWAMERW